jgi:bifunctional NMN adenylyltransferase/nudix hydrolase
MEQKKAVGEVGVIVGRFQVPYLHEAHVDLINTVKKEHSRVIIFLGLSPARVTKRNPLDFEARKQMIHESFPDVTVLYIKDMPDDKTWSRTLDTNIQDVIGPQKAVLYGSRDSFISHYSGKYITVELIPERMISGSELRKAASQTTKCCPSFREGVIWAASNQWPKAWPTVDVAVMSSDYQKVLLGRKPHETKYRFIGGFVDPTDGSLEVAARREVREETGNIEISDVTYISSSIVDDWRYRYEDDKIITTFFSCTYVYGCPTPTDDIGELRWFPMKLFETFEGAHRFSNALDNLVSEHVMLMKQLVNHLTSTRNIKFLDAETVMEPKIHL